MLIASACNVWNICEMGSCLIFKCACNIIRVFCADDLGEGVGVGIGIRFGESKWNN